MVLVNGAGNHVDESSRENIKSFSLVLSKRTFCTVADPPRRLNRPSKPLVKNIVNHETELGKHIIKTSDESDEYS